MTSKSVTIQGKTIVHIWTTSKTINCPDSFWGFGDMIRGTCALFTLCEQLGINLVVDWSHHPISAFLETPLHKYSNQINWNRIVFKEIVEKEIVESLHKYDFIYFCTNGQLSDWNHVSPTCQTFLRNLLKPRPAFQAWIDKSANRSPYKIVHVRLGDAYLNTPVTDHTKFQQVYTKIQNIIKNKNNTILLSDTKKFKQYCSSIPSLDTEPVHIGVHNPTTKGVRDTLMEFFVASRATQIYTYSEYGWTSGFMVAIHKIYDVPIVRFF